MHDMMDVGGDEAGQSRIAFDKVRSTKESACLYPARDKRS
jgi:hypothetical protein